jgi:2-phospho-L-lactate/phosphoenolpyruvate guanylyltransferase
MATVAVLPVKRFAHAKQRLGAVLAPADRLLLAEAMLRDVLGALGRVRRLYGLVVVTREPRARALARGQGAVLVDDPREDGQAAAAELGIRQALEVGAERVLLVPGDCPGLDPEEVDGLLREETLAPAVTIVPDRHGTGTNAMLLSPPGAVAPSFGAGSFARHVRLAEEAGAKVLVRGAPSLELDVDTAEDLQAFRRSLVRGAGRSSTLSVLASLEAGRRPALAGG